MMISQPFGSMGVLFTIEPEATATLNYNEKLLKVRNTLNSWKYRRLSLIGKKVLLSLGLFISYHRCV